MSGLPKDLQNLDRQTLKNFIDDKNTERGTIQKQIAELSIQRDAYLKNEKMKNNSSSNLTLQTEIEKIILTQAKKFNLVIP